MEIDMSSNLKYKDIERCCLRFLFHRQIRIACTRVFALVGEQDIVGVNRNGYPYEIEIKMSKSDYYADFQKTQGYTALSRGGNGWNSSAEKKHDLISGKLKTNQCIPRKFWFAVPAGLIKPEVLPDYAGLLYVDSKDHWHPREVKKPKLNKNSNRFKLEDYESLLLKLSARCYNDYVYHGGEDKTMVNRPVVREA